ncbi:MAG: beta-galactosidase, partial [Kiritimatiellae bacterium]|nr:beta-galactosidase [Kiritimatiellia bacterium]
MRSLYKIDKCWKFLAGDCADAQSKGCDDSGWRRVDLPHDWSIEGSFSRDHCIAARYDANHLEGRADSCLPKGIGWYRKDVEIAGLTEDGRVYVEFEGVFRDSTLWVNGHEAGNHPSGYTGVVYDITPWVHTDGRPNVLAVRVDARLMEGWWYEGAGIYRHVWLTCVPALHVAPWGIAVTTPHASYTSATVAVRTNVVNRADRPVRARLRTTVEDDRGNPVGTAESEMPVEAGQTLDFLQELTVADPRLWSPETPSLYRARSELVSPDGDCDGCETTFGIRWFEFTPDRGFFLNGRPLQLRGG